jgi:indolepyruvate decarboxylase
VSLKDFINGIARRLRLKKADLSKYVHPCRWQTGKTGAGKSGRITLRRFYDILAGFIRRGNIIIADTGDSLLGSANLYLPENVEYIGQAFYMSIGYSLPATLGAALAEPNRRIINLIGDGAFQMTAQELSTIIRRRLDPVIFILNNEGYTVERIIQDGPYNDLQPWKYYRLPEVFNGGKGYLVRTEGELVDALKAAAGYRKGPTVVEVVLDKWDSSENLRRIGKRLGKRQ